MLETKGGKVPRGSDPHRPAGPQGLGQRCGPLAERSVAAEGPRTARVLVPLALAPQVPNTLTLPLSALTDWAGPTQSPGLATACWPGLSFFGSTLPWAHPPERAGIAPRLVSERPPAAPAGAPAPPPGGAGSGRVGGGRPRLAGSPCASRAMLCRDARRDPALPRGPCPTNGCTEIPRPPEQAILGTLPGVPQDQRGCHPSQ